MISNTLQVIENRSRNVAIVEYQGRVIGAMGCIIIAILPKSKVGDLCQIIDQEISLKLFAEVVAIENDEIKLLPFGSIDNISTRAIVYKVSEGFMIKVGDFLLGQIVDGLGNLITKPEQITNEQLYPLFNHAPDPLKRKIIIEPLLTGVKAIDLFITCGRGQRLAIFAGPGMGKTTLLSMIIGNAQADVIVIALIGERGREVNEFIELDLNKEARKKCIIIVATSERPPVEQVKAAYVAQTIAEYFRDLGKNVILFVDSITRFARAQREVGLSAGEPIARGGFPPSVFSAFSRLMERAGNNELGTITAFYTVLMEGEDTTRDPIADEVRSIIDGHILLSKKLVEIGHFPAINILASLSRVADRIISSSHMLNARKVRMLLSKFEELEFLLRVGEYKEGNDPIADEAIKKNRAINKFLQQSTYEQVNFDYCVSQLASLAN